MSKPAPKTSSKTNLEPVASESEIRKHYYRDRYVIIAPKRGLRPDSFSHHDEPHKVPNPTCPFCHNEEKVLYAKPTTHDWQVKVVTNKFSQLSLANPKAYGTTEVVINTPDHNREFSELSISNILEIFKAYRARMEVLRNTPGIRYVLVFKNDGPVAGASVAHAHCQIYALPLIPPQIEGENDDLNHYRDDHDACAVCDVLQWELKQRVRVIYEDKYMMAIAPYASTHIFEAWIIPKRHERLFGGLTGGELESLAVILKKMTARLDAAEMSFNYHLREAIDGQDYHFMLRLEPRRHKEYAGAEMGTGIVTNPVAPEYAALWYHGKV